MTDGWIAVPQDSNGKRLRTDYVTTSGGTVVHTEYVRADHSSIVASNASFGVNVPGYIRVLSATAASFLVSATLTPASYQKVLNASYASFLATVQAPGYVRAQNPTYASFLAQIAVPGSVRVQNATTAASLLAQVNVPGILRQVTTRGSNVVQADHSVVVATNASFGVNVPGVVRVVGPASTASFVVGTPGYQRVTSNTAASFLLTAKAVSLTNASFLAQVSIPAFVNVKGPTTRGSTIVDAGHSLIVSTTYASFLAQITNTLPLQVKTGTTYASFLTQVKSGSVPLQVTNPTAASFLVNATIPGILREVTTRGSAVMAVDHSALVSVSAASFLVGAQAKSYTGVWPAAQSTGVYNPSTQDSLGRLVVLMNTTPGKSESTVVNIFSAVPQALFNAVAGNRHYITDISLINTSATDCGVTFVSGGLTVGKRMAYIYATDISAGTFSIPNPNQDRSFITPPYTNVGSTFAAWLSRTVQNVKITVTGYQSTV